MCKPKKEKPVKFAYMLVAKSDDQVYLYQRPQSGIWGGLYSFPEFESLESAERFLLSAGVQEREVELNADEEQMFRHTFSHYHFDIQPVFVNLTQPFQVVAEHNQTWLNLAAWLNEQQKVGLSAVAAKLLEQV